MKIEFDGEMLEAGDCTRKGVPGVLVFLNVPRDKLRDLPQLPMYRVAKITMEWTTDIERLTAETTKAAK